jgi:hypothetical protein
MYLTSLRRATITGAIALSCVAASALGTVGSASANLPTYRTSAKADKASPIKVKVDSRLFGLHDAHLSSLTSPGTRSIRLWDTGTAWKTMQPDPNQPINFSRLDQIVSDAWDNHTEVTFVAAMTPTWAAAPGGTVTDGTEAPLPDAYGAFLSDVMTHYENYLGSGRPGIANYQVWNEANIDTFWTGTPQQMADLVKTVYDVRAATDPSVRVIAPAQVARYAYQRTWTRAFYKLTTGGQPVWKYVDAIAYNLYPVATYATKTGTRPGTPEDSMALLATVRADLAKDGVPGTMPIWNTEINYGMGRGTATQPISTNAQVANVIRTYLLNAAQGVKRVEWYAFDMGTLSTGGTLGNTLLTNPLDGTSGTLTPAGRALTRVQSWMAGTLVGTATKRPCIRDANGTYTCLIKYATGVARVYWNPYGTAKVTLVSSARKKYNEYGASTAVDGGQRLKVNYMPVLVKSRT